MLLLALLGAAPFGDFVALDTSVVNGSKLGVQRLHDGEPYIVVTTDGSVDAAVILYPPGGSAVPMLATGDAHRISFGDLDRNGHTDFVVAVDDSVGSIVRFNNFGGSFTNNPVNLKHARNNAVGDVDDDGALDIVWSTYTDGSVGLLSGPSLVESSLYTANVAGAVDVGDIDRDGSLDVLQAWFNTLSWYSGGGSWAATTVTNATSIRDVHIVDVDGDGIRDALYAHNGGVKVTFLDASHAPGPIGTPKNGGDEFGTAYGDIDLDGDLDVAGANNVGMWWVSQTTSRSFDSPEYLQGGFSTDVDLFDYDTDGDLDVLGLVGGELGWAENLTVHRRGAWPSSEHLLSVNDVDRVEAADIDADGWLDLVVVREAGSRLVWLRNNQAGSFDGAITIESFVDYNEVDVGDIDGDGELDLVACGIEMGDDVVWYSNASFNWNRFDIETNVRTDDCHLVDLDHDGDLDLVTTTQGDLGVYEWSAGGFGAWQALHGPVLNPGKIDSGDVTGDGTVDLVYTSNEGLWLYDGSLGSPSKIDDMLFVEEHDVALGDLDGDGDLDVVAAGDDEVVAYLQDGGWTPSVYLDGLSDPELWRLELADLDADGTLDILVSGNVALGQGGSVLAALLNDGSGSFSEEILQTGLESGDSIAAADFDRDGYVDFAYTDSSGVYWFRNEGGQVQLDGTDPAVTLEDGTTGPALLLDVSHLGRIGDHGVAMDRLLLELLDANDGPLGDPSIITAISLYEDDGDGSFDAGDSPAVWTTTPPGTSSMILFPTDVLAGAEETRSYWLTITTASDASSRETSGEVKVVVIDSTDFVDDRGFDVRRAVPADLTGVVSLAEAAAGPTGDTGVDDTSDTGDTDPPPTPLFILDDAQQWNVDTSDERWGGAVFFDLDGDEFPDLAYNTQASGTGTRILQNTGGTQFADLTDTVVPGTSFDSPAERGLLAGDLDNDGNMDVIRVGPSGVGVVFTNGIDPGAYVPFSSPVQDASLVDIDGDGFLDILVMQDNGFTSLRSSATRTFTVAGVPGLPTVNTDWTGAETMATADIDGDGYIDLAARLFDDTDPVLWLGGAAGFTAATSSLIEAVADPDEGAFVLCDLDNDFDLDAVHVGDTNLGVANAVLRNEGSASWTVWSTLDPDEDAVAIECGDLDHDGYQDLVIGYTGNTDTQVWLNPGDGSSPFVQHTADDLSHDGVAILLGDIDADGDLDLFNGRDDKRSELWINGHNGEDYLLVRAFRGTHTCGASTSAWRDDLGARVFLGENGTFLGGIREINSGRGRGSQGFYKAHFTGLTPKDYEVYVDFTTGVRGRVDIHLSNTFSGDLQELHVFEDDIDQDNVPTSYEIAAAALVGNSDPDGDGLEPWNDPDSDGDGTLDADEVLNQCGDPLLDDTDGDGVPNILDPSDGGGTAHTGDTDTDADTDSDTDSDTDADTDTDSDADADTDSDTDADTDADSDADSDSDSDADADTDVADTGAKDLVLEDIAGFPCACQTGSRGGWLLLLVAPLWLRRR